MQKFTIKRGDTLPTLSHVLDPASTDLTDATVVALMRGRDGVSVPLSGAASVAIATGAPTVQYLWGAADTVSAGLYEVEFQVTFPSGAVQTFPRIGYIQLRIEQDIAPAAVTEAPEAFTVGQWTLADVPSAGANTLGITLSSVPAGTGSVFYTVNSASDAGAVLLAESPAINAQYMITVPAGAAATIRLFASNAIDLSGASDAKTATPTLAPPVAFTAGQWALDDSPSAGGTRLAITLSAIPATATAVRYSLNGGPVTLLAAPPATGTPYLITVPALVPASVRIFATNTGGSSGASDAKTETPSSPEVAPSAFTSGMWTLIDSPSPGADTLTINITALPSDGGSPITALQYSLNAGGAWSTLIGIGTGARNITVLASTASSVILRAVNVVGEGPGSDTKTETPTSSASSPFTAIASDGWRGTHPSPPTFDPVGSPVTLAVTRSGFDATGAPTAVVDQVAVNGRLRQAWPTEGTLTASTVVMNELILAGDSLPVGVTNSSTRAYAPAHCLWLQHDHFPITGATFQVDLVVMHRFARNGRPVAAVDIIATDGVTSRTVRVTALSWNSWTTTGFGVDSFRAIFTSADFIPGVEITVNAILYPWAGPSYNLLTQGNAAPNMKNTVIRGYRVTPVFAYVVSGGSGTPQASSNPATAAANPFANIAAAATGIRTFNNANFSRDEIGGGVIRFPVGTWTVDDTGTGNATTHPQTTACIVYESINPADKATTILADNGAAKSSRNIAQRAIVRNMVLRRTTSVSTHAIFRSTGATTTTLVFDNADFDLNGQTAANNWINWFGRGWFYNCRDIAGGTGVMQASGTDPKNCIAIGSTVAGNCCISVLACSLSGLTMNNLANVTLGRQQGMIMNNRFSNNNAAGFMVTMEGSYLATPGRGYTVFGNVFETFGAANGALRTWADGNTDTVFDLLVYCNSIPGNNDATRWNQPYSDVAGATGNKDMAAKFNISGRTAAKTDVFAASSVAIGNWPVAMRVGHSHNSVTAGIVGPGGTPAPGAGSWRFEHFYPGIQVGDGAGNELNALYTDDRTAPGPGGGDYRPQAGSPLRRVPAGLTMTARDMLGQTIPTDGTAFVGALQAP